MTSRFQLQAMVALGALLTPAPLVAQQLGGGGSPDVSIVRIVGALVLCLVMALLAILYLKYRSGAGTPPFLRRLVQAEPLIDVREVRRLTVQHSISIIRHRGEEYLLLLTPGDGQILARTKVDVEGDEGAPS